MPQYTYSALDEAGKSVKGVLVAESELAALDQITHRKLTPTSVQLGGNVLKWWQRDLSLSGNAKLRQKTMLRFFQIFAILLRAKHPLSKSLQICKSQIRDPLMISILEEAQSKLANGATISAALTDENGAFPKRYLRMIQAGESSNQLAAVVQRIAKSLEDERRIQQDVRQALIYPTVLIVMSALVVALLVFYLIPTLMPVFQTAQAELPFAIRIMNSVRVIILQFWPILLIAGAIVGVFGFTFRNRVLALILMTARALPGIEGYLRKRGTLTFCQTLGQYLSSGDHLQSALLQTRSSFVDPSWVKLLDDVHREVEDGKTLVQALEQEKLIDPIALALLETGEEGDKLIETLEMATANLTEQTSKALSKAVGIITPILTLVIGLGIGAVILSTISAILDMNEIAF